MKKTYSEPMAEKIEFDYQEQVVASGQKEGTQWDTTGDDRCDSQDSPDSRMAALR